MFLISTAGEAQSSGSGFMQTFIRGVAAATAAADAAAAAAAAAAPSSSSPVAPAGLKSGVTLLQLAELARNDFNAKAGFGFFSNATGPIEGTSDVRTCVLPARVLLIVCCALLLLLLSLLLLLLLLFVVYVPLFAARCLFAHPK